MKMYAKISKEENEKAAYIILPNNYEAIEDALDRSNTDETVYAKVDIVSEYGLAEKNINLGKCNIFELNYLAKELQELGNMEQNKFFGAIKIIGINNFNIDKLINLSINVRHNEIVSVSPAEDAEELGEFYLTNDLIPEIEDINDVQYQWMIAHISFESVGKQIQQKEKGVFIGRSYVTVSGELENLNDNIIRMPNNLDYIFKIDVGYKNANDDSERKLEKLKLPTSQEMIDRIKLKLSINNSKELECYNLKSIIPILEPIDYGFEDLEALNQIATEIKRYKNEGKFKLVKAVIDAIKIIDVEAVKNAIEFVDDFKLNEKIKTESEYGKDRFKNVLPEDLLECLDTKEYGRKLLLKNGAQITEYGTLISNDGISLEEKISRKEDMNIDTSMKFC